MIELLAELDDRALSLYFDDMSLRRGRAYAADGRVDDLAIELKEPEFLEIRAMVQGNSLEPYDVEVQLVREGHHLEVFTDCSCFVAEQCKHGVAALIVARDGGRNRPASGPTRWGRELDTVLQQLEGGTATPHVPIALQFALREPPKRRSWHQGPERPVVTMRPLRRGARDNWVKTGAAWSDAPRMKFTHDHDPGQAAVMADLAGLRSALAHYAASTPNPSIEDFGPGLWLLLQRAREAGIEFLAGPGLVQVDLLGEPVSLLVDAVEDRPPPPPEVDVRNRFVPAPIADDPAAEDRAAPLGARVEVGVRHSGHWYSGEDLVPVGRPGHGVALIGPTETLGRAVGRRLRLAPLDRSISDPVRRLLIDSEAPVRVPAQDLDRLATEYLPRLRRHLPVASSDGVVVLPEEPPPALVLTVGWAGPGRITLGWQWRYRFGSSQERVFDLDSQDGLRSVRRADLERAHLAGLNLDAEVAGLLLGSDDALAARQELRGDRVLTFVAEVLPVLEDHPGIEVVQAGVQPDYREAEDAPEIRFELADPSTRGRRGARTVPPRARTTAVPWTGSTSRSSSPSTGSRSRCRRSSRR